MRTLTFPYVTVGLVGGVLIAADYPEAEISNDIIHAKIMLPDAERRSYQGTRFDWSGIVASLQYKGHEYFGQWYDRHDPKIHDAITGPVEEFLSNDADLGYNEAKPGGTFVRIGVGVVRKPDEKGYRRFETYEIVEPGKRAMRSGPDWIEFTQELASDDGYAYVYRKQDAPVDQREARTGDRARAKEHRKKDHRHGAIQP